MDEVSQKRLNSLVSGDVVSLTPDDVEFLRARRSYLNDAQRERFHSILSDVDGNDNTSANNSSGKKVVQKLPQKLDRRALAKQAKKMGITVKKEYTAVQIKALITEKEMEEEALKEDAELKAKEAEDIRTALESRANELGLTFDQKISDDELRELITAADPELSDEGDEE